MNNELEKIAKVRRLVSCMQSIERIACGELRVLVDKDAESDVLPCLHQNFDSLISHRGGISFYYSTNCNTIQIWS